MAKTEPPVAKPLCFVVGPIGSAGSDIRKHSDLILHAIIKEVMEGEEFGYEVRRADDDARPGMINDRIIHDIVQADLVVADLTDLNANAFYELGIRHAAQKPTIHIAKLGTPLPFDNAGHDTTFVDVTDWGSITKVRERLAASTRAIRDPSYRVSNPITQANASFAMKASADPKEQVIADLLSRITNIENHVVNTSRSDSTPRALRKVKHDAEQSTIDKYNRTVRSLYLARSSEDQLISDMHLLAEQAGLILSNITLATSSLSYWVDDFAIQISADGKRIDAVRF